MAEQALEDIPLNPSGDGEHNKIPFEAIPDNTFTIVLKAGGKVYALGGEIGEIKPDTPDEDLDSVLRAANGAGVTLQRTIAMQVAGRDAAYKLPGDHPSIEQDLTPKVPIEDTHLVLVAAKPIEKGQAVQLTVDGKVEPIDSTKSE